MHDLDGKPELTRFFIQLALLLMENGDTDVRQLAMPKEGYSASYSSTYRGRLAELGLIAKRGARIGLTEKGMECFRQLEVEAIRSGFPKRLAPAEFHVRGAVKAGPFKGDKDVDAVRYEEFAEPDAETVPGSGKGTYAVRVDGKSMEHEGIRDGDYLIVRDFEDDGPKQGTIVILKYLPMHESEGAPGEAHGDEDLVGPVVKVFAEEQGPGGRMRYRLGWTKQNDSNPYRIDSYQVRPVAEVLGVYRPIGNRMPKK